MPHPDPVQILEATYKAIQACEDNSVWISILPRARAQALLAEARARRDAGDTLPLFGLPFAIKDNIDLAGLPTTAACPGFAYTPDRSAHAVERLIDAGAIRAGKTNLDQFATGLNGTRSPYGLPANVFDPALVPGGSSSGSAVAVAAGLVAFALGTDTAGSGRVPAAFNNIIGIKPTRGLVSARGVVPACRSLDCVSVLALTVAEALDVLRVIAEFDPADAYSRREPTPLALPPQFRFGVASRAALAACDDETHALYEVACARLQACGGTPAPIDFTSFRGAGALLYAGPWVAERLAAIRTFAQTWPESIHPAVREVVQGAAAYSAADAWDGQYRLADLVRAAETEWAKMDLLLLPTTPFVPTVAAMMADPLRLNAALGAYTNFVNLMDLAAIAVPAGFTAAGAPFGVTLVGPAFSDAALAAIADRLHRKWADATLGGTGRPLAPTLAIEPGPDPLVRVAVVGAHLSGQPLNRQLTERDAHLIATARTAPCYRLYALPGTNPPKPGLLRVDGPGGPDGIELEVWAMPPAGFGALVAEIPPPLGIGTIALDDGTSVQGFVCEAHGVHGAEDITHLGGWRAYLRRAGSP